LAVAGLATLTVLTGCQLDPPICTLKGGIQAVFFDDIDRTFPSDGDLVPVPRP